MGVSAPMVVSTCSKYLSYDIGGGDWGNGKEEEEEEEEELVTIEHNNSWELLHTQGGLGGIAAGF